MFLNIKRILVITSFCSLFFVSCKAEAQQNVDVEQKDTNTVIEPQIQQETKKDLKLEQTDTTISMYWYNGGEKVLIKEFNNLQTYKKRYYTFSNHSIVGYLPKLNRQKIDNGERSGLLDEFELFFCNIENGEYQELGKGIGIDLHIKVTDNRQSRWIINASDKKAELFLLHETGEISKQIRFSITFRPEIIELEEIERDKIRVLFGILDKEEVFEIDFSTGIVTSFGEKETPTH